jgi:hypothetical protein
VTQVPGLNPFGNPTPDTYQITGVAAGLQASGNGNSASLTKVCSPACSPQPSATVSGNQTVTQVGGIGPTMSVRVTDTYTFASGNILNVSNSFIETDTTVPEPGTLLLMGGALVGLSLFGRGRRRA